MEAGTYLTSAGSRHWRVCRGRGKGRCACRRWRSAEEGCYRSIAIRCGIIPQLPLVVMSPTLNSTRINPCAGMRYACRNIIGSSDGSNRYRREPPRGCRVANLSVGIIAPTLYRSGARKYRAGVPHRAMSSAIDLVSVCSNNTN